MSYKNRFNRDSLFNPLVVDYNDTPLIHQKQDNKQYNTYWKIGREMNIFQIN